MHVYYETLKKSVHKVNNSAILLACSTCIVFLIGIFITNEYLSNFSLLFLGIIHFFFLSRIIRYLYLSYSNIDFLLLGLTKYPKKIIGWVFIIPLANVLFFPLYFNELINYYVKDDNIRKKYHGFIFAFCIGNIVMFGRFFLFRINMTEILSTILQFITFISFISIYIGILVFINSLLSEQKNILVGNIRITTAST